MSNVSLFSLTLARYASLKLPHWGCGKTRIKTVPPFYIRNVPRGTSIIEKKKKLFSQMFLSFGRSSAFFISSHFKVFPDSGHWKTAAFFFRLLQYRANLKKFKTLEKK